MTKGKKRSNVIAMITTMVVIFSITMITAFASAGTYKTTATTSYRCRVAIGKGEKGKAFTATRSTATVSFTVNPESAGSRKVCYLYQVAVNEKGKETVCDVQKFERDLGNTANEYNISFNQTIGASYRYVFSIEKALEIGQEADWPRAEDKVKYPFVIKQGLTLEY